MSQSPTMVMQSPKGTEHFPSSPSVPYHLKKRPESLDLNGSSTLNLPTNGPSFTLASPAMRRKSSLLAGAPSTRRGSLAAALTEGHEIRSPRTVAPVHNEPASTRLRRMIKDSKDVIVCPGVYDGISARAALETGFRGMYMTGAGTSLSRLGIADMGIAQLADMKANAEMIASLDPTGPPVIADMDTGYGGPMMVARSVQEYIRAGIGGFHIEDQILAKRCGHLGGKEVVDRQTYYSRIGAALGARQDAQSDIVIIARTDALQTLGYDECLERLKAARDMGADVGLLEGFTSKEQAEHCCKELAPWPLLLNVVENGVTPPITASEAQEMGFKIMIFSFATSGPAYLGIKGALEHLKTDGIISTGTDLTPKKLFQVCGLDGLVKVEQAAGGKTKKNNVDNI